MKLLMLQITTNSLEKPSWEQFQNTRQNGRCIDLKFPVRGLRWSDKVQNEVLPCSTCPIVGGMRCMCKQGANGFLYQTFLLAPNAPPCLKPAHTPLSLCPPIYPLLRRLINRHKQEIFLKQISYFSVFLSSPRNPGESLGER